MKKGSKNSRENRGEQTKLRKVDGKETTPVHYIGKHHGHGNYMAGKFKEGNAMVKDAAGKPIPYGKI